MVSWLNHGWWFDLVRPKADGHRFSRCARALLRVLAQRHVANYSQLAALAGYSRRSSGFADALSGLRVADSSPATDTPSRSPPRGGNGAGDVERSDWERAPKFWERRLGKCEASLLPVVYESWYRRIGKVSRARLALDSGYSATSSGFRDGLSTLRVLGLVLGPNGGDLEIADVFKE